MNRNRLFNFLMFLLLSAVVFFGYAITRSVDRLTREVQKISQLTEQQHGALAGQTPASVAVTRAVSGPAVANARFFDPAAVRGGTLNLTSQSDVGSLNPILSNDAMTSQLNAWCNSSLAERDWENPSVFVPMIAESWTISEDRKSYRIFLRKGVMWQDFTDPVTGKYVPSKEVTAADFVFYLDVVRNVEVNGAAIRSYYQDLDQVIAVGDYELQVTWKNEYFRSLELTLGLTPLPQHFYCPDGAAFDPEQFNNDHLRNRMIVGCGAYRFDRWETAQYWELKRFSDYFGNALGIAPPIDKIHIAIVKAPTTALQMLLGGKIDALSMQPEQWVSQGEKTPFSQRVMTVGNVSQQMPLGAGESLRRIRYLSQAYFYIGYNLDHPLFEDRKVRQALTMLTDRNRILKDVYCNLGRVISGPFFYDSPYYDKSIEPWPFDVERAKKQLAEAGWLDRDGDGILDKNGRKFEFTAMQVANNALQEKILTIVKEDMAKAGIEMKIAVFEWPVYLEKLEKRSYEVCSLGWALPYESDPYQVWHSSQADTPSGSNHVLFRNAEADRLIEAIRVTFDVEKRIELCHQFQKLLHEEQPYTFLLVPESLRAVSDKVHNIQVFPLGTESTAWYLTPEK